MGAFLSAMRTRLRLWTMPPVPMTRMPSSRRGGGRVAELEELLGGEEGHGELEDGDFGFGPGEAGRDPGAVVEAADGVEGGVLIFRAEGGGDACGESGIAGGGVRDAEELVGEAGEIVEKRHGIPRGDAEGTGDLPVGGDDEDGASGEVLAAEGEECRGVRIAAEGGHGGSVGEEGGGGAHGSIVARTEEGAGLCLPPD